MVVTAHPNLDNERKTVGLRTLDKAIWIQNDCRFPFPALISIRANEVVVFARPYVVDPHAPNSAIVPKTGLLEGSVGQIVTGVVIAIGVLGVRAILRWG